MIVFALLFFCHTTEDTKSSITINLISGHTFSISPKPSTIGDLKRVIKHQKNIETYQQKLYEKQQVLSDRDVISMNTDCLGLIILPPPQPYPVQNWNDWCDIFHSEEDFLQAMYEDDALFRLYVTAISTIDSIYEPPMPWHHRLFAQINGFYRSIFVLAYEKSETNLIDEMLRIRSQVPEDLARYTKIEPGLILHAIQHVDQDRSRLLLDHLKHNTCGREQLLYTMFYNCPNDAFEALWTLGEPWSAGELEKIWLNNGRNTRPLHGYRLAFLRNELVRASILSKCGCPIGLVHAWFDMIKNL